MINFRQHAARILGVGLAASTTLGFTQIANVATPAHADPFFATAKIGGGSDTLQDVFNAYAGYENGTSYAPLVSTNGVGLQSWEAIPPGGNASTGYQMVAKLGFPSADRANGSKCGGFLIGDAAGNNGSDWNATQCGKSSATGAPGPSVTGEYDFGRSSGGPDSAGTVLDYVTFARDGVDYVYWGPTADLGTLTTTQLNTIYSSAAGAVTIGSTTVEACLPQFGSGTRKFFMGAIGVTDSSTLPAIANCPVTEENGANSFYAFGSALPAGEGAIIPFSAASLISQINGAASDRSKNGIGNGVGIGLIGTLPLPYTGTITRSGSGTGATASGPIAANPAFYSSTVFGRDTYVILPHNKDSGFTKDADLVSLFGPLTSNPTPAMCSAAAVATAQTFGFETGTSLTKPCGTAEFTGSN